MSTSYRVEVELEDFLDTMEDWEKDDLVNSLASEGYGEDTLRESMKPMDIEESLDADPANVIVVVTWLRKHRYSVEPTGWDRG